MSDILVHPARPRQASKVAASAAAPTLAELLAQLGVLAREGEHQGRQIVGHSCAGRLGVRRGL